MKVAKRTEAELKRIIIYAELEGVDGWVVHIEYKDGKAADIPIEPFTSKVFSMLDEAFGCIKLQMAGSNVVSNNTK